MSGGWTALNGVKVAELAHVIAAPHAAQILAWLGAEVTKIETAEGDIARRLGPPLPGGSSAMYAACNRGKTVVTADIRSETDRARVRELVVGADVFITSLDGALLSGAGLDYGSLADAAPRLVYAEVSGFGRGGFSATDGLAQLAGGMSDMTGYEDMPGVRAGPSVVDVSTGVWTALGIMAALEERRARGRGRLLQVSLSDVALAMQMSHLTMYSLAPEQIRRLGNRSAFSCTPLFQAADGRPAVTILHDRHWRAFCEAAGRPELATDPRFADDDRRRQGQAALEGELRATFASADRETWLGRLRAARIPCAPERTYAEVLSDMSLYESGVLAREGAVVQVNSPIRP
jgi:crotonobetainyl-CoA:carnitine CoA-transferase CaiB-like acyl-CoA transferase